MNIVEQALQIEAQALNGMSASLDTAISQMANIGDATDGPFVLACPEAAKAVASIAAGQVPPNQQEQLLVNAMAIDLSNDVVFGLKNASSANKVQKPDIHQHITLGEGVTWQDVSSKIQVGIDYAKRRLELMP